MTGSVGIVGSGLAGATLAVALRLHGFEGSILLFGEENRHAYDRPCLSKAALLTPLTDPVKILPEGWETEHDVTLYSATRVTRVDPTTGTIETATGQSFAVDRIVLATGACARELDIPGAKLPGVLLLRTWDDMIELRERLGSGRKIVIVGGGLIGCEVATSAMKLGAEVTILETAPVLLERVLGSEIGRECELDLERMGARIICREQVARIEGHERVAGVLTASGKWLPADLVLVSIGGTPCDQLAHNAGVECERGVIVDAMGRSSAPNLWAVGDVANWPLRTGGSRTLETYLNAQSQAECVAQAITGSGQPTPQIPKGWTEIAGHKIQIIGEISGHGSTQTRESGEKSGKIVFRLSADGTLSAAVGIDAPTDFAAAMRLVERGFRPDNDELVDPTIPLRDLVRKSR